MSILIKEIPVTPEKIPFPKNIEKRLQSIVDIGTFMIFIDSLKRESMVSFVLEDVFVEMQIEKVKIGPKLVPCEKIDSVIETIEIMCDKELLKDIRQGLKEAKEGKLISHEDFLKKHNFK